VTEMFWCHNCHWLQTVLYQSWWCHLIFGFTMLLTLSIIYIC